MFKVNQDSMDDVILLASKGVSFLFLAGLYALLCLASIAEPIRVYGWVFHHVLELR